MLLCFNPTLVRLRLNGLGWSPAPPFTFQSHAGSIEAAPTPRRLCGLGEGFQSHAGSIEAIVSDFTLSGDQHKFQSHAGSIEAFLLFSITTTTLRVSIPRWFD